MAKAKPVLDSSLRSKLTDYILQQQIVELVYRDSAGQVQVVHSRIRDLFTRPGGDFVALDKGVLLAVDHILILDGHNLNGY
ncbi:MAG: hypothetical protein ACOCVV_10065 [Marinobacter sp.]